MSPVVVRDLVNKSAGGATFDIKWFYLWPQASCGVPVARRLTCFDMAKRLAYVSQPEHSL
jgi:hypothetical protein